MPELPEVEILVRQLRLLLRRKSIRHVEIRRKRAVRPDSPQTFREMVAGAKFKGLSRRGKYLLFRLEGANPPRRAFQMLGHLGMTGRMYVALKNEALAKHAAIVFDLGDRDFIYEDPRYFGRMTLDLSPIRALGAEPLADDFSAKQWAAGLKKSRRAIKIKLIDQDFVAGLGNIYASEALFRARLSPKRPANRLMLSEVKRLRGAVREVLKEAIKYGSTVPLKAMSGKSDALFYYSDDGEGFYEKRLRVYGRAGKPCLRCGTAIRRMTQGGRSTFFCPHCQKG
jgi:formamidopyrimidine-DNA glycosylase